MRLRNLAAVAVATLGLSAVSARADTVGFIFGINDNGGAGIVNTSTAAEILSLSINFAVPGNDTFFDTTNTPPGTASTPFSTFATNGSFNVFYPNDALVNGQQAATLGYSGFGRNESLNFNFDLDQFDSLDGSGAPIGGLVTVSYSTGDVLTSAIVSTNVGISVVGYDNSARGSADVGTAIPSAVPLPGVAWGGLVLFGMLGGKGLLSRRKRAAEPAVA